MGLIEGTKSRVTEVNLEAIQGSSVPILHSPASLSLASLLPPPPPLLLLVGVPLYLHDGWEMEVLSGALLPILQHQKLKFTLDMPCVYYMYVCIHEQCVTFKCA